ncbi:MAG: cytochrome c [Bacteroidales bacterium]|nr:cytochrome c [Bacteroidales bacterium]
MKKLTLSTLAVLFIFSLSSVLLSCGDDEEKTTDETTTEVTEVTTEEITEVKSDYSAGEKIYTTTCQACHQANGEGVEGSFPGLKGKAVDLSAITNGREGTAMIAYKNQLSDQEIADVANFVNHSFGNNFDEVTVEDIAAVK